MDFMFVLSWAQDQIRPWGTLLIPAMISLALRSIDMTDLLSWARNQVLFKRTRVIIPVAPRHRVLRITGPLGKVRALMQVLERQDSSKRWAPVKTVVEVIVVLMNALDGKACFCKTTESLIAEIGEHSSHLAQRLCVHRCLLEDQWIECWAVELESGIVAVTNKSRPRLPDECPVDDPLKLLQTIEQALLKFLRFSTRRDWEQLTACDPPQIDSIMSQVTPWRGIEGVEPKIALDVMDYLQACRDQIPAQDSESPTKYVKCLRALSKEHKILPSQLYFDKASIIERDQFSPGGGFSDISRATVVIGPRRLTVCLKRLRISGKRGKSKPNAFDMVLEEFTREAFIWRQLSHSNILPFYGISKDVMDYPSLCLISPWMEDGNIIEFLDNNPKHDRLRVVWDIASGLAYLHELDPCIIHKDIRGPNILVGPKPHHRCRLADFGISIIAETQKPALRERGAGNIRWTAPELSVRPTDYDPAHLWAADIYSFGCTIIEIYTGKAPYSDVKINAAVMSLILDRILPEKPPADVLPSALWRRVVRYCLSHTPTDRLSAREILAELEALDSPSLKEYLALIERDEVSLTDEGDGSEDGSVPEEGA